MASVRSRLLQKPVVKRGSLSTLGWASLMRQVIARAETVGDRRVAGLKAALQGGESEALLRKLGIICENDVAREFPDP